MDIAVDTWTTLAGGRHILTHGVSLIDPFSFHSRPPHPPEPGAGPGARMAAWLHPSGWINQAWLTYAFLAAIAASAGLSALVAWKCLNCALIATVLVVTARLRRAEPRLAILLTAGALVASRSFFEVRAQDVTNLLATVLMLLLAVTALRAPRAVWLVVPLFALWGNAHGGFVWGLMALALFVGAGLVSSRLGGNLLALPPATLRTAAIASASALVAVVVASPFRLANLTHPLLISFGAEAREWRNVLEWMPLARGATGERVVFIAAAAVALLAAIAAMRRPPAPRPSRSVGKAAVIADVTRSFDLGSAAILVLTCAMAWTSRRFLPMAYLVGAPLVAQWLTVAGERFAGARAATAHRAGPRAARAAAGRLAVPAAWLAAAAIGVGYAVPFARTYLEPWPFDTRRVSVADRAMLTVGQPWGPCEFVTLNHLQGRLWNFWEHGGFWEWCQTPAPVTGRVALQVAIDGRAQQAFDIAALRWHDQLETGGPAGADLERSGRQANDGQLAAIDAWVTKRLTQEGIWIAHVAQRNLDTQLARVVFNTRSWQVVYVDANHFLLVDAATPQGHEVVAAVDGGTAAFPDDVSALLTRAYRALHSGSQDGAVRALALSRQSWALRPTTRAVGLAALAGRDPACTAETETFFQELVDDQIVLASRHEWQPGYYERLVGAVTAAHFLEQTTTARGDAGARSRAAEQRAWLAQEADRVALLSEW